MAKGQQRGNREVKKPKKEKPKVAATAQPPFGLTPEIGGGEGGSGKEEIARVIQLGRHAIGARRSALGPGFCCSWVTRGAAARLPARAR